MTAPAIAGRPPLTGCAPAAEDRVAVRVGALLFRDALAGLRRGAPAGAAVMTVLVGHAAVAPHLALRGAGPDVVLAAVVAVALGRGARVGAAFGFAAGLGADVFLTTPLGTTALAATLLGHAVGTLRPLRSSSVTAGALCGPGSTCFSCRTGRAHRPAGGVDGPWAGRSVRSRQRAATRRRSLRRSLAVTGLGVGTGQLVTTMVATGLGGVPLPGAGGFGRMAAVAVLSAPLGPPLLSLVRRSARPGLPGDGR